MENNIDKKILDMLEFETDSAAGSSPASATVDFDRLFKSVRKNWKKILFSALAASVVGLLVGISIPRTYTTTTIVAPELTTRTSSSGLTSLASLAGININSMAVTDAMHPDMYPAIVKSTDFITSLFDMPVEIETKDGTENSDLYNYILNEHKHPWWTIVLRSPIIAKEKIKDALFSKADDFDKGEGYANINPIRLTREQEIVTKILRSSILVSVEKKTYLLSVQVKMQDRIIAAQLANRVVENLQRFIIDYRTERARHNVEYYKRVVAEAKSEYLKAQHIYAEYADSHQEISRRSSEIETQRLHNEANLRYQMYNSLCQQLLQAEAKVQLESPVLVVIQKGLANRIGKPSKVKLMMLFFLLGALGAIVFIYKKKL